MINTVDIQEISQTALIVAIGVVGLTQFLKNFFTTKKGKGFAICSVILTAILCICNTSLVPSVVTALVDLFSMSLSITQLAWDVLAKGIPHAAAALLDKMAGATVSEKINVGRKPRKVNKDDSEN